MEKKPTWQEQLASPVIESFSLKQMAWFATQAYPDKLKRLDSAKSFISHARRDGELKTFRPAGAKRVRVAKADALAFFNLS